MWYIRVYCTDSHLDSMTACAGTSASNLTKTAGSARSSPNKVSTSSIVFIVLLQLITCLNHWLKDWNIHVKGQLHLFNIFDISWTFKYMHHSIDKTINLLIPWKLLLNNWICNRHFWIHQLGTKVPFLSLIIVRNRCSSIGFTSSSW